MNTLYKDILLDHYRNPRNRGTLENPHFESGDYNPSCGDGVTMQGTVANGTVENIVFQGNGCVISQATASLLTVAAVGKTLAEVRVFTADDIQALIGMQLGIIRLKCALLPLYVLQRGIADYCDAQKKV